ncbi:tetratricopeptide repeat protein [Hyphococcus lacteus]|uniref:Tetratricopeptide repeat protein n=1 Tax=Hyphococcus lacteus TaxID=3143536 RepID=A0ABV3Z312_9PROT
MKRLLLISIAQAVLITACAAPENKDAETATKAQKVQQEPEAMSLLGEPLYAGEPSADGLAKLAAAKAEYDANPGDADALIWFGRRIAYLGRYQEAIDIFTVGIEKHPEDARMLRHRGHRYISTRQFDKAIADLSKAADLIVGKADQIEPDGLPNAMNIPLTSLHGNIRYHLGLAYYLKHDWENARRVYAEDFDLAENDDGVVASGHWLYMILRRMGRDEEAAQVLERIDADMEIIENTYYHRAGLFYKGELSYDEAMPDEVASIGAAGIVYGIANWYLYNDEPEKAYAIMNQLVDGPSWAAFGYIAAEKDLAAANARVKN